jgi:hypothetical protein
MTEKSAGKMKGVKLPRQGWSGSEVVGGAHGDEGGALKLLMKGNVED